MNITFSITVHNFLSAATIEEILQKNEIKYSVDSNFNTSALTKKARQRKRGRVTELTVRQVIQHHKNHPNDSYVQIAKAFALSDSVIGRIINNTHPIQKRQNK